MTTARDDSVTSGRDAPGDSGATALARILQFGDSMLPVGAFSFSGGLESAIQQGVVRDIATLREFVLTVTEQAASLDGIGVLAAHRAATAADLGRVSDVDRAMYNRKLSEENRTMTTRMGKKLAEMGAAVTAASSVTAWLSRIEAGDTPGTYPAGLAVVFASLGLTERDVFVVHQYGVAMVVLGASMRLMKVSHLDTQAILFEVNARAAQDYARAAASRLDDMAGYAPMLEILAAVHVKAHVRLFMN